LFSFYLDFSVSIYRQGRPLNHSAKTNRPRNAWNSISAIKANEIKGNQLSHQLMIAKTHLGAHVLVDLIGVPGSSLRQSDASPSQLLDAVRQIKDGQWIDASLGNLASQILYVVGA